MKSIDYNDSIVKSKSSNLNTKRFVESFGNDHPGIERVNYIPDGNSIRRVVIARSRLNDTNKFTREQMNITDYNSTAYLSIYF